MQMCKFGELKVKISQDEEKNNIPMITSMLDEVEKDGGDGEEEGKREDDKEDGTKRENNVKGNGSETTAL